jgi:hypothetical protein
MPHGALKQYDMKEQEYRIIRDLHCWEVDVTYNVRREGGEGLFIIFRLKDFPDIPFEFNKAYHQPKVGSQHWEKWGDYR